MKNGKKIISIAVASLIAVPSLFAGCKNSNGTSSGTSSTPVTISMYTVGGEQPDYQRIETAVDNELKAKGANIKLDLHLMATSDTVYGTKVDTMLSTNQEADVVFTCNWAANYRSNAVAGYFRPLNSYLTGKYKDIITTLGADFANASQINGKNYALPTNKEKAHDYGVLLRTDLVKKYNIDTTKITKLSDLDTYFAQIKANEAGVTPLLAVGGDSPYELLDWDVISDDSVPGALPAGGTSTTIVDQFIDPTTVALYKTLRDYFTKGYISKDAATQSSEEDEIKTGKYFAAPYSLKPGKDKEESQVCGHDYTQIDLTTPVKSNRETTGAMLAIPTSSKHPDQAMQFIDLLYSDKTLINLLVFGEKDKDYTVGSDGKITTNANAGYKMDNGWTIGNQFNNLLLSTESSTKWTDFKNYNDKAKALPSLGFIYDNSKVSSQLSACQNVVKTYNKSLFTGSVDVDSTVAKFTSDLNAAGAKDLIADMQTQYDKFRSSKK